MTTQQKLENLVIGFENFGYVVLSQPIQGKEAVYYAGLLTGLKRVENLHKSICRGSKSARALALLHDILPEPCWGVEAMATVRNDV